MENKLIIREYESPIGPLTLGGHANGSLSFIEHGTFQNKKEWIEKWKNKHQPEATIHVNPQALNDAVQELEGYFQGKKKSFQTTINLSGTPFQKQVWETLQQIPYGQMTTYKQIAEQINHPKAVRAVGGAINKNPLSIIVPCHRVIGTNQKLTGYRGGLERKEQLLSLEKNHAY